MILSGAAGIDLDEYVHGAMRAGAAGFLLKPVDWGSGRRP
jgi:YesN/AraC family two-component response regulator